MTDSYLPRVRDDDEPLPRPTEASPRLKSVALTVGLLMGVFGAHRFYAGKIGTAFLQLGTLGALGVWWLYDMILIVAGEFTDKEGRRISRWNQTDPLHSSGDARRVEELSNDLDGVRREVSDLAERLDFAERMLAQGRERGRVPPG